MTLFICSFCGDERKSKRSKISHETLCAANPNRKESTLPKNRITGTKKKAWCKWCEKETNAINLHRHETRCKKNPDIISEYTKKCPQCGDTFFGKEKVTCSYSCSNRHFRHSRKGGTQYKEDTFLADNGRYRELCFRYHKKECVICGEDKIVEVHHLNENHNDNSPENLIPLCPTHHKYFHSRYRHLIEDDILSYIKQKKIIIGDEEAGSSAAFGTQRAGFDSPVSDQKDGGSNPTRQTE